MTLEWEEFLDPYIQAVGELKIKLRGIRKQYRKQNKHSPIEFVTGRVKPIESIKEKMARRGITYATLEHDLQDIAGLRVMVQFVDDVKEVVEILRKRQDMRIIQERDYITHRKASGYRSYQWSQVHFGRNSNTYLGHEFLGNDRTFSQLQVPRGFPRGD